MCVCDVCVIWMYNIKISIHSNIIYRDVWDYMETMYNVNSVTLFCVKYPFELINFTVLHLNMFCFVSNWVRIPK